MERVDALFPSREHRAEVRDDQPLAMQGIQRRGWFFFWVAKLHHQQYVSHSRKDVC